VCAILRAFLRIQNLESRRREVHLDGGFFEVAGVELGASRNLLRFNQVTVGKGPKQAAGADLNLKMPSARNDARSVGRERSRRHQRSHEQKKYPFHVLPP